MKLIFLSMILMLSRSGWAQGVRAEVKDVKVRVFDAVCTRANDQEAYLRVELSGTKTEGAFYTQGTFYSYSQDPVEQLSQNWNLIPLTDCRNLQDRLLKNVGKEILLDAVTFTEAYQDVEITWGECRRGSPRIGIEYYRCEKSRKPVTRYRSDVLFKVGNTYILLPRSSGGENL